MARRLALIGAVVVAAIGSPASVSASASGSSDGAAACASAPLGTLTFACGGLCNAAASCVLQDTRARSPCSLLSASIEVGETKTCTTAPSRACRAVCFAEQRTGATTFTFYVAFNTSTDGYMATSSSRSSDGSGSSAATVPATPSEVPFESNRIVRRIGELALPSTTTNVVISGGRTQNGTRGVVVDLKLDAVMFRQAPQVMSVSLLNMDLRTQDVAELLPFTLRALDLRNTKLQQLPQAITSFTQLETLVLDMNDLTDMPSTVKLPTLQTLRLRDNALTAFDAILPSLRTLDLSANRLQVFPYAVLASPRLRSLRIANNPTMKTVVFSESQFARLASLDELTIDMQVLDTSNCQATQVRSLSVIGASVCVVPDSEWTASGVLRKEAQSSSRDLDPELEKEKVTGAAQDRSSSHTTRTIVIVVLVALVLVAAMVAMLYLLRKRHRRLEEDEAKAVINSRVTDSATGEFERMRDNDDDAVGARPSPPRQPRRLESCESDASCVAHLEYSVNKDPELVAHRIRNELIEDVRIIGSGGFAVVWLVTYTPESRPLAAKRLLSDHATRAQTMNFVLEIKLHMRLVHPSIVECVGVAWTTTASDLQVLFEYMPHGDLRSHLQSTDPGRWPWGYDKLHIAIDVIEALVYVHSFSPPLMHRDLKSRNVLLADEMKAKLCDFGVSRFASGDTNSGMTTAVGTAKWLAPEVIAGRHDYDEACDLYAFGMILSELDTHQLPFDDAVGPQGDRLPEATVLQLVACGKLQPTLSVTCPAEIRSLALQCLAFDPADRPSAIGVAYALRRLRNDWFKHKKLFRAD